MNNQSITGNITDRLRARRERAKHILSKEGSKYLRGYRKGKRYGYPKIRLNNEVETD